MIAPFTILTGVKPTGTPHIGNYIGAIRPAIELANHSAATVKSLLFIADYHAMTSTPDASELRNQTYEVAASWLALGTRPERTIVYRQSDVPETFELAWILSCFTEKGWVNRAHAYKSKQAENLNANRDPDQGVNFGLYSYPVLMAADIVLFNASIVPVGPDQIQHLEIARDIVQKLNAHCRKNSPNGDFLQPQSVPPEVLSNARFEGMTLFSTLGEVMETRAHDTLRMPLPGVLHPQTVPGLDGQKMSKSYQNTIPIFLDSSKLRKLVMKIKTDPSPESAPKDPDSSIVFQLYKYFATSEELASMRADLRKGLGWGYAKERLFTAMDRELAPFRQKYDALINDRNQLDQILEDGALRARHIAVRTLSRVRRALGLRTNPEFV